MGQMLGGQSIKLTGNKEHVIAVSDREHVLTVAAEFMDRSDEELSEKTFAQRIDPIQNPFTLEDELTMTKPTKNIQVQVVYDDMSILKAIAESLSKEVRGSLSRGETPYLQLQGGSLLKSGSVIPARIPQIPDQVFNVTVSEVTAKGYTLSMNESSFQVFLDKTSEANSAVRFSE